MDKNRLRIAIQKSGRLSEKSLALLRAAGLRITVSGDNLFCRVENLPADILLVRDDDIPVLVANGSADMGIVGLNVCEEAFRNHVIEESPEVMERLDFGRCKLCIAVREEETYDDPQFLAGRRIATTYPNILKAFLDDAGISAKIVRMKGAVEVAPRMGIADLICDLVSTGATLEANGLKPVETILESEAVLIRSAREIEADKVAIADRLLQRIRGVLTSRESKYIMMNAPKAALGKIREMIPGARAPTVMPLAGNGDMVAVHAVCSEMVFWETLERLKAAGASAILVLPIEKMLV